MSVRYAFLPLDDLARVHAVREIADVREVPRDAVIVREGERPFAVHVVQRGAVVVRASPSPRARGPGPVLEVLGQGDAFGLEAVRTSSRLAPDRARALPEHRALVDSSVLRIDGERLCHAAARDDRVAGAVLAAAAAAVERRGERLGEALEGPASARLLGTLRGLAARFGRPADGGVAISLPLRQELLAGLVGTTRETVNRSLAALERAGAVRYRRGRYVVAGPSGDDLAGLAARSNSSSVGSVTPLSRTAPSTAARATSPSAWSL